MTSIFGALRLPASVIFGSGQRAEHARLAPDSRFGLGPGIERGSAQDELRIASTELDQQVLRTARQELEFAQRTARNALIVQPFAQPERFDNAGIEVVGWAVGRCHGHSCVWGGFESAFL